MSTQYLSCPECHKKFSLHQKLFESLYDFERMAPQECPACGGPRELHVILDFQLGSGEPDFEVVSASLPDKLESWLGEEEEEVTFYPFLVVLERTSDRKRFCWMPYWHVTGKEARYGQHAICLERNQFEYLVTQAHEKLQERELEPV
jgi:hypothetical protein